MPVSRASAGSVSVVLPCLDEVESVGACVAEASDTMRDAGIEGEVVVVDNGSTDGSPAAAERAGARVVFEPRPGYGRALRAGFAAARHDVIVMADADFTYDLTAIPALVEPIFADRADLVIGSRLGGATSETMPFLHRFVGTPVLSYLISRSAGRRLTRDSQSGYRAFRRSDVLALGLRTTGMELASEMLVRAARRGMRIEEVSTIYRARIGSSKLATFSDGLRHAQLIFMLAPDLLLVRPGAALGTVGAVMAVLGLGGRTSVEVGSLRWQPVFFSNIALVLGAQGLLAGTVLEYRASVTMGRSEPRFAFVGSPSFPSRCLAAGAASVAAGLVLDAGLFAAWLRGSPSPPVRSSGVASLAQSLLILGGTLASFGLTGRSFLPQVADSADPADVPGVGTSLPTPVRPLEGTSG